MERRAARKVAAAVDVANASGARLSWLEAYALAFGWSWELVPEEPWHLHYYTGDAIPQAVLDYEQEQGMTSLDDTVRMSDGITRTYHKLIEDLWEHLFYAGYARDSAALTAKSAQSRLQTLVERPAGSVTLTPEDRAAIVADLHAALQPDLAALAVETRDAVADLGEGGAAQVRADE